MEETAEASSKLQDRRTRIFSRVGSTRSWWVSSVPTGISIASLLAALLVLEPDPAGSDVLSPPGLLAHLLSKFPRVTLVHTLAPLSLRAPRTTAVWSVCILLDHKSQPQCEEEKQIVLSLWHVLVLWLTRSQQAMEAFGGR